MRNVCIALAITGVWAAVGYIAYVASFFVLLAAPLAVMATSDLADHFEDSQ